MSRNPDIQLYERYLEQFLDRALTAPEIREDPPLRFYPEVDDYTMSMGMAQTPGGRIWLGWFAGGDDDRAVIVLAYSDDGGETFSGPRFFLEPGYVECGIHLSAVVGNLWTAPDGRLFLFFTQSLGYFDGRGGSWYSVCANPDSATPEWSVPQRIWHGASLNKPTVLRDGSWLLPVALWPREMIAIEAVGLFRTGERSGLFHELDPERKAQVFASKDAGKTWVKRGGAVNFDRTFDEHMIVERNDGSLFMYLRSKHGTTKSESFDGGYTWSEPVPAGFPNASARFFLRRLRSGNLLLVRHANPEEPEARSHLTAFLSDDEGESWKGGLLLDERHGVSYPDGFQSEDGRIFIQYDYKRECGEILLATFTEADVLAGTNVSGEVRQKHTLMQSRTRRLEKTADNRKG